MIACFKVDSFYSIYFSNTVFQHVKLNAIIVLKISLIYAEEAQSQTCGNITNLNKKLLWFVYWNVEP